MEAFTLLWGHWVSASLARAGVMLGDAARRKCCDTRVLDLLISVRAGISSHGTGSHKSLGTL